MNLFYLGETAYILIWDKMFLDPTSHGEVKTFPSIKLVKKLILKGKQVTVTVMN